MAAVAGASAIRLVTLQDGTQIAEAIYISTMMNVQLVSKKSFSILYELYLKCKDASYKFSVDPDGEDPKKLLMQLGLLTKTGKIHEAVKAIVLNAVIVEKGGVSITIINPIKRI